jgi:hypothetical protein
MLYVVLYLLMNNADKFVIRIHIVLKIVKGHYLRNEQM